MGETKRRYPEDVKREVLQYSKNRTVGHRINIAGIAVGIKEGDGHECFRFQTRRGIHIYAAAAILLMVGMTLASIGIDMLIKDGHENKE